MKVTGSDLHKYDLLERENAELKVMLSDLQNVIREQSLLIRKMRQKVVALSRNRDPNVAKTAPEVAEPLLF